MLQIVLGVCVWLGGGRGRGVVGKTEGITREINNEELSSQFAQYEFNFSVDATAAI